ncbi:MAG: M1 family metallopeptidase, partial [Candidatus Micrarchaeota archaeon]|nr:M1 family metallopeptidase [Candidatus Micrarchaeota archaeon]
MDASKHDTLGDNVLPENYSLIFEPDLKSFKTMVKERITCRVKQPTKSIKINSKEILISWAEIRSGKSIQTAKVSLSPDDETATFNFKDPVKGKIELWIDAVCTNNEGMYGFYRSRYSANGKDRYILTSQFEAANARAAFPCFDEPSFKATFEVSMLIDKSLDAVSNMPVAGESKADNGKKLVRFKKTLRMSTYLLYLFVGNYDFVKGNLGKLSLRVITVPGKSGLAKLPLENAKSSIKWYQDYFGINLPLQKMDLLAIPDFAAGAMENWGAITFREVALLGNDKTGISTKQFIAEVIAHELTHQWFGDLVTMKWWDDLWLNESFADFMATKPVAQKFPRWETELQYVAEGAGTAFSADSLKSTHPISVHVNRPAEIDSLFDSISYEKGGSVLYMLEDYVGKDIFRKGLNIYLKKHAYSNAEREDLWKAIQAAADMAGKRLEVSSVMQAWVTKVGHPIVEVKKSKNGFVLTQKRFTLLADMEGIWPIPMHYLTESGEHTVLMKRKTIEIEDKGSWIKLNLGQHGFYRARYPKEIMDSLGQMIKSGKLEKIDAWGVESDLFSAVRSGREPIDSYISFVEEYCLDIGYPVDGNVVGHLGWLFSMTYGTKNFQKLKAAILRINGRYLGKLGWAIKKGERESDTMLRGSLISSLGIAGDKRVLARASRLFDD